MLTTDQRITALQGHAAERIMPPGAGFAAVLIPVLQLPEKRQAPEVGKALEEGKIPDTAQLPGREQFPVREISGSEAGKKVPYILFEERSRSIRQGGEICFPGGMLEAGEDAGEAVIRETMEELLLERENIALIAPMHVMSGPGGTEVTSFVGRLGAYSGACNRDEVTRTFAVPLRWFLEHEPRIYQAKMITEPPADFPYEKVSAEGTYRFHPVRKEFVFYDVPGQEIYTFDGGGDHALPDVTI